MLNELKRLGVLTITTPRAAARELLGSRLTFEGRLVAAALVVVLSAIVSQLIFNLDAGAATESENLQGWIYWAQTPFGATMLEAGMLAFAVLVTVLAGRIFGGKGNFGDAILLITWLQAITLGFQIALSIMDLVARNLGMAGAYSGSIGFTVTFLVLAYMFWVFVNFVTELHGFRSAVKVLGGTILAVFAIAFGLTSLIAVLSVT